MLWSAPSPGPSQPFPLEGNQPHLTINFHLLKTGEIRGYTFKYVQGLLCLKLYEIGLENVLETVKSYDAVDCV